MLQKKTFLDSLKKIVNWKHPVSQYSLTEESIIWGYRLFLDRDPENFRVINYKLMKLSSFQELRRELMRSDEFKRKNPTLKSPTLSGDEPPMLIEDMCSEVVLQDLFKHIQESWKSLGEKEPYWSVLTVDNLLARNIEVNKGVFYESGKQDANILFNFFNRNRIDYTGFKSALEYGCGLGRVTQWLAEKFEIVHGYDISQTHLNGAEQYLTRVGVRNIILKHIKRVQDIQNLPKVDLVYSILVLQHNPPPLISLIIREFIKALNPGGIAFFQVPTYQLGYSFSLERYLSGATKHEMEMHILPQSQIFEIIRQEGGKAIEVIEDDKTCLNYKEVSNTFLVQKS